MKNQKASSSTPLIHAGHSLAHCFQSLVGIFAKMPGNV
jgi:hypothetical protein